MTPRLLARFVITVLAVLLSAAFGALLALSVPAVWTVLVVVAWLVVTGGSAALWRTWPTRHRP